MFVSGRTAYGLTAVRSAMVEWSINVGEMPMQMEEGKFISVGSPSGGNDKASDRCGVVYYFVRDMLLNLSVAVNC